MKCSTCGAFVPDDSVFCLECGARVSDTAKTDAPDDKTTNISSAGAPTARVYDAPPSLETEPFGVPPVSPSSSSQSSSPQPFGVPPVSPSSPSQNSSGSSPQPFGVPPTANPSSSSPSAFSVPETPQPPQPYMPPPPPTNMVPPYNQSGYPSTAIPNSSLAITSLVSGILGWFTLIALSFVFIGLFIGPIGALISVITGHMARKEIRNSGGTLSGDGMAIAGLALGYSQLAVAVLGACGFIALIFVAVAAA